LNISNKIANLWAVWDQRITFAMRLDQKPLQFISWGVQLTTLLAVLSIKVKYSALAIGAAVVLIVVQGWLLSKTKLQKKFDAAQARQNQEWLDHVAESHKVKADIETIKNMIQANK
jgi:hypothetical protein